MILESFMLFALEMAVLERFLVKHSQETLGVNEISNFNLSQTFSHLAK